ncbi:MAG: polymer-forming cytoskeletal protein [Rhodocyclaceae bacterium]
MFTKQQPVLSKNPNNLSDRSPRPGQPGATTYPSVPGSDVLKSESRPEPVVAPSLPETPVAAEPTLAQEAAEPSGSRLIVGPDVKLKGAEILDCDTLIVEGRVEATMDSRVIRITERGAFAGKVGIDIAEVHGVFEGELTARQQLIIHATGRVKGKIRYGKLLIESGGVISGEIEALADSKDERNAKITPLLSSAAG